MGEIKSTLDIIMEKTKGLTMTDEEKKRFQKKAVEGKARGLIQKFLDRYLDREGLEREIAGLDKQQQILVREALRREGLARVDADADNTKLFELLENTVGFETAPIRKMLSEFSGELAQMRVDREKRMLERFAERGISGSAIIPNVNADPGWIEYVSGMKEKLKKRIDAAVQNI
jgi:hypothetical protein